MTQKQIDYFTEILEKGWLLTPSEGRLLLQEIIAKRKQVKHR